MVDSGRHGFRGHPGVGGIDGRDGDRRGSGDNVTQWGVGVFRVDSRAAGGGDGGVVIGMRAFLED